MISGSVAVKVVDAAVVGPRGVKSEVVSAHRYRSELFLFCHD